MNNDGNGMTQAQYDNARAKLSDKDFETWLNGGVEVKRTVAKPNAPDPVRPPVAELVPVNPGILDPGKLVDPVKEATPRKVLSNLTINSPQANTRPNTTNSTPARRSDPDPRDQQKSVCKPRPEDNTPKGSGGGGFKREFIPWCDRKR